MQPLCESSLQRPENTPKKLQLNPKLKTSFGFFLLTEIMKICSYNLCNKKKDRTIKNGKGWKSKYAATRLENHSTPPYYLKHVRNVT